MKKLFLISFILLNLTMMAQNNSIPNEKYHEFDFWLGKWDVYKMGNDTISAKSEIESIIDSVGILENYAVVDGNYKGKSLNKFNSEKNRWEQFWIDNSGLSLFLSGGLVDGKMILDDLENANTKNEFNQIIWWVMDDGSVRQIWNVSKNEGKTWSNVYDGHYKKRKE